MNLALVGVQQDGGATAADVVHGVLARHQHGRSVQNDTDCGRVDHLKSDLTTGHDALPLQAGALSHEGGERVIAYANKQHRRIADAKGF